MGRNECGQRAAARMLSLLGHGDDAALRADLATRFRPDTPLRLLGTTPDQLARALRAYGEPGRATHHAAPAQARAALLAARMGLACVDLRHLGARWPMLHWVHVAAADAEGVDVDMLVRTPHGRRARFAWPAFLRAWRCAASPLAMHRYALVTTGN